MNLKIGARLAAGFGAVLALLLATAGVGASRMADLRSELDEIVTQNDVKTTLTSSMRASVNRRAIAVRNVVLFEDVKDMKEEVAKIEKAREDYAKQVDRFKGMRNDATEQALLEKIGQIEQTTKPLVDKVIALGLVNDNANATKFLVSDTAPAQDRWLQALGELQTYEAEESTRSAQRAHAGYANGMWVIGLTTGIAIVAGILFAVLVARSITKPLARAVQVAKTVAAGDLTSRIDIDSRDETGQLLHALKDMNASLLRLVEEVRTSSDSIATGSTQIAIGNADLSQRTEEQASNLQQTAASMEQLTATTRQNTETAQNATAVARQAQQAAVDGGTVVGRVVETMEVINTSSKRIGDIIGTIDGIAFQTNILALNAAVEAARAGEQGRGFAVVAGEVRALAQRSAAAAKEVKQLVGDSVAKVEGGTKLVADAGRSMDDIVARVSQVNELIAQISSASAEQRQGFGQIGDAVAQLDQVTQQNAALVEESAAAADSLSQQAKKLTSAVAVFRTA